MGCTQSTDDYHARDPRLQRPTGEYPPDPTEVSAAPSYVPTPRSWDTYSAASSVSCGGCSGGSGGS